MKALVKKILISYNSFGKKTWFGHYPGSVGQSSDIANFLKGMVNRGKLKVLVNRPDLYQ